MENIMEYLNDYTSIVIALTVSAFVGFVISLFFCSRIEYGKLGTLSNFLKKGNFYFLKNELSTGNKTVYIFQKIKVKNLKCSYSREYYIEKDSNFSLPMSELKAGFSFKVLDIRTYEREKRPKISSLSITPLVLQT